MASFTGQKNTEGGVPSSVSGLSMWMVGESTQKTFPEAPGYQLSPTLSPTLSPREEMSHSHPMSRRGSSNSGHSGGDHNGSRRGSGASSFLDWTSNEAGDDTSTSTTNLTLDRLSEFSNPGSDPLNYSNHRSGSSPLGNEALHNTFGAQSFLLDKGHVDVPTHQQDKFGLGGGEPNSCGELSPREEIAGMKPSDNQAAMDGHPSLSGSTLDDDKRVAPGNVHRFGQRWMQDNQQSYQGNLHNTGNHIQGMKMHWHRQGGIQSYDSDTALTLLGDNRINSQGDHQFYGNGGSRTGGLGNSLSNNSHKRHSVPNPSFNSLHTFDVTEDKDKLMRLRMDSSYNNQVHSASTAAAHQHQQHAGMSQQYVYHVKFKYTHRYYLVKPNIRHIKVGDYVKVEADRGEDLGWISEQVPATRFWAIRYAAISKKVLKYILRLATPEECSMLVAKNIDEQHVTLICREILATTHPLPISIVDSEYQFDRNKLTIYHDSKRRVDFREFVRDLFTVFKTRIWMQLIDINSIAQRGGTSPLLSHLPTKLEIMGTESVANGGSRLPAHLGSILNNLTHNKGGIRSSGNRQGLANSRFNQNHLLEGQSGGFFHGASTISVPQIVMSSSSAQRSSGSNPGNCMDHLPETSQDLVVGNLNVPRGGNDSKDAQQELSDQQQRVARERDKLEMYQKQVMVEEEKLRKLQAQQQGLSSQMTFDVPSNISPSTNEPAPL